MKAGFFFISFFGLFLVLTFVFFSLNLYSGEIQGTHFTVFYYFAWIFIAFSVSSAYLGYTMPGWFKNLIGKVYS